MSISENKQRMLRGDLYHAFTPELVAERTRCRHACQRFNGAGDVSRRQLVQLWRDIINDPTPLPPPTTPASADAALFASDPWIEAPLHVDYGTNVRLGAGVFLNFNCTILDTCAVRVGARTLVGPNVSFYAGTHPLDPALRDGTAGPELGAPICVGDDCWIGGNVVVLPGVTLGRGCVVGAGSVVTKDVPAFHVAAGNPARVLRRIDTSMDPEQARGTAAEGGAAGAEEPMAEMAEKLEGGGDGGRQ